MKIPLYPCSDLKSRWSDLNGDLCDAGTLAARGRRLAADARTLPARSRTDGCQPCQRPIAQVRRPEGQHRGRWFLSVGNLHRRARQPDQRHRMQHRRRLQQRLGLRSVSADIIKCHDDDIARIEFVGLCPARRTRRTRTDRGAVKFGAHCLHRSRTRVAWVACRRRFRPVDRAAANEARGRGTAPAPQGLNACRRLSASNRCV